MANSLSSKKRIRQNEKHRMRNRARKSAVKTQIKRFLEVVSHSNDMENAEKELRLAQKKLDRLVVTGVMHKNTAGRRKAQLMRKMDVMKAKI